MKFSRKKLVLSMALLGLTSMVSATVYAAPATTLPAVSLNWTAGTAVVDGNTSDWNLSTDASTRMCEAGWINTNGSCNGKEQLSTLYTRYNCNTNTMYVLVLKANGHTADNSASWVKVYTLGNSPRVTGPSNSANFHDVTVGGVVQGYEASFTLAAGTYNDVEMHIEIDGSRTSSTGKVQYTRSIVVPESCTVPAVVDNTAAEAAAKAAAEAAAAKAAAEAAAAEAAAKAAAEAAAAEAAAAEAAAKAAAEAAAKAAAEADAAAKAAAEADAATKAAAEAEAAAKAAAEAEAAAKAAAEAEAAAKAAAEAEAAAKAAAEAEAAAKAAAEAEAAAKAAADAETAAKAAAEAEAAAKAAEAAAKAAEEAAKNTNTADCDGTDGAKAPTNTTVSWADDKGTNSYGFAVTKEGNTWTYQVDKTGGKDLSHWTLIVPSCVTKVSDATNGVETGQDGSIKDRNVSGIKWNSEGGTFSFTLDGDYAVSTVEVLAKAGNGYSTSMIMGPDCSMPASNACPPPVVVKPTIAGAFYESDESICSFIPKAVQDKNGNDVKGWTLPQWIAVNGYIEAANGSEPAAGLTLALVGNDTVKICPAGVMAGSCHEKDASDVQPMVTDEDGKIDFAALVYWPGVPSADRDNGAVNSSYSVGVMGGAEGTEVLGGLSKKLLWNHGMMNNKGCTITLKKRNK